MAPLPAARCATRDSDPRVECSGGPCAARHRSNADPEVAAIGSHVGVGGIEIEAAGRCFLCDFQARPAMVNPPRRACGVWRRRGRAVSWRLTARLVRHNPRRVRADGPRTLTTWEITTLPEPPDDGNELSELVAEIAHFVPLGEVAVADVEDELQPLTNPAPTMVKANSARRIRADRRPITLPVVCDQPRWGSLRLPTGATPGWVNPAPEMSSPATADRQSPLLPLGERQAGWLALTIWIYHHASPCQSLTIPAIVPRALCRGQPGRYRNGCCGPGWCSPCSWRRWPVIASPPNQSFWDRPRAAGYTDTFSPSVFASC